VQRVLTHCPYCALNCGLKLKTAGGEVVGYERWKQSPFSGGALCSKGVTAWQQVHHPDRLIRPLVRRDGELEETTWEHALDVAAHGFADVRRRLGPEANAVMGGGSLTNEKAYLVGKFARLALGTPHVDLNGRMCMSSAAAAAVRAFGLDRAMTPLSELAHAHVAMVIGANISSTYPVKVPTMLDKVRRHGRVIVVDPRGGRFVARTDLHLALKPGTDAILANGLLRAVAALGLVDRRFVDERTTGFEDALAAADPWTPHRVEAATGVDARSVVEAARLLASAKRAMVLHARGAEQQTSGTQNVLAYVNVALACGLAGKRGCGIVPLTGQRNGQGGREHGQRCDQLPGARSIEDPEHRRQVAAVWGVEPQQIPGRGRSFVEVFDDAHEGRVAGMLTISTNPAVSSPDLHKVRRALSRLEHLVVIDPFLSETAEYASVVLPGTTFAEEDGTITTTDGRVVRVDAAVGPQPGRGDIDVFRNLANRLGAGRHFGFVNGREVFEELRRVSAGGPADYSGMTWDGIRARGGIFWPCPEEGHPGTPTLYTERFAHPDGKARFHAVMPTAPPVVADGDYPLVLTTGRVLAHYLSGNQTRRIDDQNAKAPEVYVEVHPGTATRFGLRPEAPALLTSRQGAVEVPWREHDGLRRDTLFMPYHWPVANLLTADDLDPTSRIPGLKYTPVRLEPVGANRTSAGHSCRRSPQPCDR